MVISCSAYGCTNKWSRDGEIHFHKFPFRSHRLCEKWVSALKRKNFIPTRASLVCSAHFTEKDYVSKPELVKRRLKNDAVPSVFNFPVNDVSTMQIDQPVKNLLLPNGVATTSGKRKRNKKIYSHSMDDDGDDDILNKENENQLCVESTPHEERTYVIEESALDTKYIDSFIREMVIYEEVDGGKRGERNEEEQFSSLTDENAVDNWLHIIENEDDECFALGSTWGELLKQLSSDVRIKVQKLVNQVFEDARKDVLTDKYKVFEYH